MGSISDEQADDNTSQSPPNLGVPATSRKNILSPSISVDSTISNGSTPIRKHRFDDRAQTWISLALRSHKHEFSRDSSPFDLTNSIISDDSQDMLKLTETPKITEIINSPSFRATYGLVECIEPSNIYIAVGTEKGFIVGFNYHQGVEYILTTEEERKDNKEQFEGGSVSAISFSSDSSYLVAGYSRGAIITWNLSSTSTTSAGCIKPYYIIEPTTLENRFTRNVQGHLHNNRINSVCFIGSSRSQLISSDVSGLVFYHHGFKKFMKKYFQTQKILGRNDANIVDNGGRYIIYGCEMLPLGSAHQITDYLGLIAVMTGNVLAIVSVLSLNNPSMINMRVHFKIGRTKHSNKTGTSEGCLSWYPCMKNENNKLQNAKLAYAWNNIVTILEVDNNSLPENLIHIIADLKDKDKAIPVLPIQKTCKWISSNKSNSIVSLKWISNNILFAYIQEPLNSELTLTALHYTFDKGKRRLVRVGQNSLRGLQIASSKVSIESNNRDTHSTRKQNCINLFNNSIKAFKNRLLVLVDDDTNKKLFIGRSISWADKLLGLLASREYSKALSTANDFYNSKNNGQLVLADLPENQELRREMLKPYLVNIMKESINNIFGAEGSDYGFHLATYLDIVSYLYKYDESLSDELYFILETVFEVLNNQFLFFDTIESYILSGKIMTLPPLILKKLIEYYTLNEKGELLTEMICILDVKTLDIDLAIQLCKKYKLRDCLIYIWNFILGDYATPFADFIKDICNLDVDVDNDNEDCLKVFSYMSYILTGRQYPTEKFIDVSQENPAKKSIYKLLFSATSIRYPNDDSDILVAGSEETIFPYLYSLLQFNSFETLSTINEFFEDSILNDDNNSHLTRQYIIEALFDIYEVNETTFTDFDRCQLAIFVARNYPKYSQFIRLSESVLSSIIDDLCTVTNQDIKYDCELALQSLLPLYEPDGELFLLDKLKSARFYSVLISIYRSKGKYSNVLKTWLEKSQQESTENDTLSGILEEAFIYTKSHADKIDLVTFIKRNFQQILIVNIPDFVTLINKYYPSLHSEALTINSDQYFYEYMYVLLDIVDLKSINIENMPQIVGRYMKVLCDYNPSKLYSFVETANLILARDTNEFESVKKTFQQKGLIESLTILLISQSKYEESLNVLLQSMDRLIDSAISNQKKEDLLSKFANCLGRAMDICEIEDTYVEHDGDMYLNERLWLTLIENCVKMSNIAATKRLKSKNNEYQNVSEFLDRCIHDCFKRISESKLNPNVSENEKKEKSFLVIFNRFLENSTKDSKMTTISNIRDILREVFISYSYENEILSISLKMLNESIGESLDLIKLDNLKAWTIKSKWCTSCGKTMWGPDVPKEHFMAWEDRQREALILAQGLGNTVIGAPFNDKKYHNCELIFFKCNHGYHMSCLENLGSKRSKSCVLCLQ
ncbi:DEHA2A08844p [Debaryomyces hansenii CBS767]|uniref:DEHA2A08844p n=1 Tax=Debaryomyces hansenii (strain ATCC 36239 / CBS 767 / BCRC 21394 / JCM 1990 / NBRC 0083 / IGC 2968) TaxID=284592 RepID=B5RST3_DEBHA|nr:DEHA2A08844p [Debaryomyces hansenii CBS767]CAR65389.1 DEHA2A08844p [Debaryomyces hansenii CBS767]|eukprot:XP_002770012.1 DEHA2A08844p [Debaryomyces hansenii CBS767]